MVGSENLCWVDLLILSKAVHNRLLYNSIDKIWVIQDSLYEDQCRHKSYTNCQI